ncbi:MAG: cytochrome c [Candidatus Manganitrophus sp.]|nr:cytochrome c [Candidatus Manganitrophus sp.]
MQIRRGIGLGLLLTLGWVAACGPKADEKLDFGTVSNDQDLVNVGQKIFFGKGQCALCHTLGGDGRGKCPDLEGAGGRLTREFIYETLTEPDQYVRLDFDPAEPKKYPARMPAINKPPIGLNEQELLTVIAFVQSQGGRITVNPMELKKGQ